MVTLLDRVLARFPAGAYALILVSDPDGLLEDEAALVALSQRGFTIVREVDPIRLRYRVEQARPWSVERPLLIVTEGPLEDLPYDLWQEGHRVTLTLHDEFPDLAYPLVRALNAAQREAAWRAPRPPRRLGERGTVEYLLRHVFGAVPEQLTTPAALIAWLEAYHAGLGPMPEALARHLLGALRAHPAFQGWPLEAMLRDREAFSAFVQREWAAYVHRASGLSLSEGGEPPYLLRFGEDRDLQDILPRLLRSGALKPVPVERGKSLPPWAQFAVVAPGSEALGQRASALLRDIDETLGMPVGDLRWEEWQRLARQWAELGALLQGETEEPLRGLRQAYCARCARVDEAFLTWLRAHYAPLAVQCLPVPHHVYHIPNLLAYERRRHGWPRVALLVLDGMSLADWLVVAPRWGDRHPSWRMVERLLLAQIPTLTPVSRRALIGGVRPAEAGSSAAALDEAHLWEAFWVREGLERCLYARLALDREPAPGILLKEPQALCLVDNSLDELTHGASLGEADRRASLDVWVEEYSPALEGVIENLLEWFGVVYLASDHGHVEARGIGQPAEGLIVQTRGLRARVYEDRHALERVRARFGEGETIMWGQDSLLPEAYWALMPCGRAAFAPYGDLVVTHGGPTVDEVVVPLIRIEKG